ncbi:MAG TPA: hypothetical protein VNF75_09140 [Candidatus Dormibacteraeota bacterium]|nr:hypothetical protein [Candidatus Dormibacteraeota bacterium]
MTPHRPAWDDIPRGTYVMLRPDVPVPVVLFNAERYQIAEGDLILTSEVGNVIQFDAGHWGAIGTVEHMDGETWIAFEAYA